MLSRFGQKTTFDYHKTVVKQEMPEQPVQLSDEAKAVQKNLKALAEKAQQPEKPSQSIGQTVRQNRTNIEKPVERHVRRENVETVNFPPLEKDVQDKLANGFDRLSRGFETLSNGVVYAIKNPGSTGPATRASQVMHNAFWDGAKTGGATHLATWAALNNMGGDPTQLTGVMDQLHAHPNAWAAAAGGIATVLTSGASYLANLGTSKGHDRVNEELAKKDKIGYRRQLPDLTEKWQNNVALATPVNGALKAGQQLTRDIKEQLTEMPLKQDVKSSSIKKRTLEKHTEPTVVK